MNFRLRFDENKLLSRIQQQSNNHSASRGFDLYKLDICLPCKCWVNCSVRLLSWNLRGLRGRVFHFVYLLFCYYIFYSFLLQFKTKKNLSLSSQNLFRGDSDFCGPIPSWYNSNACNVCLEQRTYASFTSIQG